MLCSEPCDLKCIFWILALEVKKRDQNLTRVLFMLRCIVKWKIVVSTKSSTIRYLKRALCMVCLLMLLISL